MERRAGRCSTSYRRDFTIGMPKRRVPNGSQPTFQYRDHAGQLSCSSAARVKVAAVSTDHPSEIASPESFILKNGVVDYYAVLQVDDDANASEVKSAYRSLAKVCHPDFTGERGHNMCILLNEAYEVLSNPAARQAYDAQLEVALRDEEDGYTGKMMSKWMPERAPHRARNEDPAETRAVFVDELSCIGCKNCVWCAPATFRMEADHGRSRVFAQWIEDEDTVQTAIDSCPVDCIHWVEREELPALEYVCQKKLKRTNVAAMMAGQGSADDVFGATQQFLKERRKLEEKRKRAQATVSPMQEEARRRAAEELAKQRAGWFGQVGFRFAQQFQDMASGYSSATGGSSQTGRVGERKRRVRWNNSNGGGGGGGGATIPLERALVLARSDERNDI